MFFFSIYNEEDDKVEQILFCPLLHLHVTYNLKERQKLAFVNNNHHPATVQPSNHSRYIS